MGIFRQKQRDSSIWWKATQGHHFYEIPKSSNSSLLLPLIQIFSPSSFSGHTSGGLFSNLKVMGVGRKGEKVHWSVRLWNPKQLRKIMCGLFKVLSNSEIMVHNHPGLPENVRNANCAVGVTADRNFNLSWIGFSRGRGGEAAPALEGTSGHPHFLQVVLCWARLASPVLVVPPPSPWSPRVSRARLCQDGASSQLVWVGSQTGWGSSSTRCLSWSQEPSSVPTERPGRCYLGLFRAGGWATKPALGARERGGGK